MAIPYKLVDQIIGSLEVESDPVKVSTIIAMPANVLADDVKACLDSGHEQPRGQAAGHEGADRRDPEVHGRALKNPK
jgi:hypothetical protein